MPRNTVLVTEPTPGSPEQSANIHVVVEHTGDINSVTCKIVDAQGDEVSGGELQTEPVPQLNSTIEFDFNNVHTDGVLVWAQGFEDESQEDESTVDITIT